MSISEVMGIDGRTSKWTGETVGFQRSYVAMPQERRFSKSKTIVLVSSITVALGTSATGFLLTNPAGSNKIVALIDLLFAPTTAPAGA